MVQTGADQAAMPRVAITSGDPNGIGPEVALKSILNDTLSGSISPVLVGNPRVWLLAAHGLGIDAEVIESGVTDVDNLRLGDSLISLSVPAGSDPSFETTSGSVDAVAGKESMLAVSHAVDMCVAERVDAMVTAPISKEAINLAGYDFPGHTEFIADRVGGSEVLMLMASADLRVGVVTGHIPLADVARTISQDLIRKKAMLLLRSLSLDFGLTEPRVAVLGLNPHAGDGGVLGSEDANVIAPVVASLRQEGFHVDGPFPADGFFGTRRYTSFDAVLAMYHDQGLIPFKALTFNEGVNVTTGLSIVRTSPDHGTAFDIAGKGTASESSMVRAVTTAASIVANRRSHRSHSGPGE